jgi:hypothetical protein
VGGSAFLENIYILGIPNVLMWETTSWPAGSWPNPLPPGTYTQFWHGIYPETNAITHRTVGGGADGVQIGATAISPLTGSTFTWNNLSGMTLTTGGQAGSTAKNLFEISVTAQTQTNAEPPNPDHVPWLPDSPFAAVPYDQISVGVFGKLDTEGNAFALLPDNKDVDATPHINANDVNNYHLTPAIVTLQSLTVMSNSAIQVSGTNNWAAVKTPTNDWVYVKATLSTSDTNAANQIQWSAGDAVPSDPFQRRVTKTVSAETTVTATLGSTNQSLNVWILWSTISFQFTNANPSPISFDSFGLPGNQLGVISYLTNTFEVGKMCAIAKITPAGTHTVVPSGWDIGDQQRMAHCFANGAKDTSFYETTWMPDTTAATNTLDGNDQIYLIDAPSIGGFASDSYEKYVNFYDQVKWNSQPCSDTNNFWHFQGRWKVNQSPQVTFTDLGGGLISLPTTNYYSSP